MGGQSKVREFENPVHFVRVGFPPLADQYVVRLHIQMGKSSSMEPPESIADLPQKDRHVLFRKRFMFGEFGERTVEPVLQLDVETVVLLPRREITDDVGNFAYLSLHLHSLTECAQQLHFLLGSLSIVTWSTRPTRQMSGVANQQRSASQHSSSRQFDVCRALLLKKYPFPTFAVL